MESKNLTKELQKIIMVGLSIISIIHHVSEKVQPKYLCCVKDVNLMMFWLRESGITETVNETPYQTHEIL